MNDVCIVGGGPGGVMLAYFLVRQGIRVTLLEAAQDFDREFRGDTLTPSVMEMLDELGLADRLLELPHAKMQKIEVHSGGECMRVSDYSFLRTRFNYITVLPQLHFLDFMVREILGCPNFRLIMGARARDLLEENGRVAGVRYLYRDSVVELRAGLVVGADGRFSRLRHLSGLPLVKTATPMDVLWFRLGKRAGEPPNLNLSVRIGRGYYVAITDRFDYWQLAMVIPKGTSKAWKDAGIESMRRAVAGCVPEFADRVEELSDWSSVYVLSICSDRLTRWYMPGLLLIGDAAHTMSSVGGVGINMAIQDAVVVSNVLGPALARGEAATLKHLREIQWRREIPVRLTQILQGVAQKQVIARALDPDRPFSLPLSLRIPWVSRLAVRVAAFGVWPVRLKHRHWPPLQSLANSTRGSRLRV